MDVSFDPYKSYIENYQKISRFIRLSGISYTITKRLLFENKEEELPSIDMPELDPSDFTYSMADMEIQEIDQVCSWITLNEYAERVDLTETEVQEEAENGNLGKVETDPGSGHEVVIWPPEFQEEEYSQLPDPGESKFEVTQTVKAHLPVEVEPEKDDFEYVRDQFLSLAHSLGEPEELTDKALKVLYRSGFLLNWTLFEVYIRNTTIELLRRNPSRFASDRLADNNLSYEEVVEFTNDFSSSEDLLNRLISKEIERRRSEGESIHSLINFLKENFVFENDPYVAWYVVDGNRKETHYNKITEYRELRNALVHEGGDTSEKVTREFSGIPTRDGSIVINEDYYNEVKLSLKSIAYHLANMISNDKYSPKGKDT